MSTGFEIQLIAVFTAVSCALLGTFLLLRQMAMTVDSITHTILLGIVLAFFATGDLNSPFLIVGAGAVGVLTVWLIETLAKTGRMQADSSTGLVFPLLFSIAIILITRYTGNVHLDTDSVLLGELAFAPFDRLVIFGFDIGAKSLYTSGALLAMNLVLIVLFYKEFKATTFDALFCSVVGISPVIFHYLLMTAVSITAVGAFEAVGSVLILAFVIAPPCTARLLTDRLWLMLFFSGFLGALSAILGYNTARFFDISIAGTIATCAGLIFVLTLGFTKTKTALAQIKRSF